MSIYASLPGITADDPTGPPWTYQGSHILPADDHPRGGELGLALIPSHITRDRRDDRPEDGAPWPWLRLSLDDLRTADPTVILNRDQVSHLIDQLAAWHEQTGDAVSNLNPVQFARPFVLHRTTDVSGVSGTGIVADGVAWPDGSVSVRWRGERPSVVFWDCLDDAIAVHGHHGATRIVWADDDRRGNGEPAHADAASVQGHCPACGASSLFLGDGGYVTCARIECPEPDAATTLLETRDAQRQVAQMRDDMADAARGFGQPQHFFVLPSPEPPVDRTTARVFAGLYRSAEDTVTRVIDLAERWETSARTGASTSWAQAAADLREALGLEPRRTDNRKPEDAPAGRIRALHADDGGYCAHCMSLDEDYVPWPCPTIRALNNAPEEHR